jgi:DNA modification methylase
MSLPGSLPLVARAKQRRIDYVALDEIAPADRNAKGHDAVLIGGSMDRFGFIEPAVLDERTGRLVAGHGRREKLIDKRDAGESAPEGIQVRDGVWFVPVVRGWSSVDDAEAEAAGIALNQATIAGGWDSETLAAMLSDLASTSVGFDGTGFVQADLDDLLHQLDVRGKRGNGVDPDAVPPLPAKPVTKPGDLWIMGEHRALCGDSTKLEDVRRVLAGEPIDFAFTSPPYNVGVEYEDNDDNLVDAAYEKLLREVVENVVSELAPGRFLAWNIGVFPKRRPFMQGALLEDCGLTFVRQCIWDKKSIPLPMYYRTRDSGMVRAYYPNARHEVVWMMAKGKVEPGGPGDYNEELLRDDVFGIAASTSTRDLWTEEGSTTTIGSAGAWRISAGSVGKVHPAPFPTALPQGFIGYLADRGAVVFDPFAGAGTTLIAAHLMGRRGVGIELSPQYCDVIAERYQRVTEELPVLARTGKPVDFLARRAKAESARA